MSKTSKNRDLWRHVYASAQDRAADWCVGCGYSKHVDGVHRADCTAPKASEAGA